MLVRSSPPVDFEYPESIDFPEPEKFISDNGLILYRYHYQHLDTAKIEFIISTGSYHDEIPGLSQLTSKCLLTGTENYLAEVINEEIAKYGGFIEISSSFDFTTLTLYSLSRYVDELVPIMHEILTKPIFAEEEIELQRSILVTNLQTQLKKTAILASRKTRELIFDSKGYGQSVTSDSLNKINQNDIQRCFFENFQNLNIIASGNIPIDLVNNLLTIFSSFNSKTIDGITHDTQVNNGEENQVYLKNSIQSSIRFGKKVINRSEKDYFDLMITNHLLGGFFGSRLMKNLREELGLTYGVYSSINHLKNSSYLAIGCDVKSTEKERAISEIRNEIERISIEPISQDELIVVKKHLIGSLQNELGNIDSVTSKFKRTFLYGLPMNHYRKMFQKIISIKPHELKSSAEKHFEPNSFTVVSVGG